MVIKMAVMNIEIMWMYLTTVDYVISELSSFLIMTKIVRCTPIMCDILSNKCLKLVILQKYYRDLEVIWLSLNNCME